MEMCKVRYSSHEREWNCTHSRLQSKYLRTGTLGRQKPESENSLVLNISSETQHQDVGWILLVRDESLQAGEKAQENSWKDERLSVSQRAIRSKRLFTYIIPHFSYLHLIDHQRHQLQLLTCPIFNENPSIPSTRVRTARISLAFMFIPKQFARQSRYGHTGGVFDVLFCYQVTFCSDISIKFVTY